MTRARGRFGSACVRPSRVRVQTDSARCRFSSVATRSPVVLARGKSFNKFSTLFTTVLGGRTPLLRGPTASRRRQYNIISFETLLAVSTRVSRVHDNNTAVLS